jgi:hypothetical protein
LAALKPRDFALLRSVLEAVTLKSGEVLFEPKGDVLHPLEARCARWLLMIHDRLQRPNLPLTQEALAELFSVARTYATRIASILQERGAISYRRGVIRVVRRSVLEQTTGECYGLVRRHFERVLSGLYPAAEL